MNKGESGLVKFLFWTFVAGALYSVYQVTSVTQAMQ